MPPGAFACGSAICRFLFCVSNKALLLLLLFSRCSLLLSCLLRNFYFPECYTSLRSVMFELRRIPFGRKEGEIRFPSALDWISVSTMHDSTRRIMNCTRRVSRRAVCLDGRTFYSKPKRGFRSIISVRVSKNVSLPPPSVVFFHKLGSGFFFSRSSRCVKMQNVNGKGATEFSGFETSVAGDFRKTRHFQEAILLIFTRFHFSIDMQLFREFSTGKMKARIVQWKCCEGRRKKPIARRR